jgi:hypothetical protein
VGSFHGIQVDVISVFPIIHSSGSKLPIFFKNLQSASQLFHTEKPLPG